MSEMNQDAVKQTLSKDKEKASAADEQMSSDKAKDENDNLTQNVAEVLTELGQQASEVLEQQRIVLLDDDNFLLDQQPFRIVMNYREAFQPEKFIERYQPILNRYDYIVGDWGYEQLRLRGFFRDDNRKSQPDQRIGALEDYLYEYCNFGCAYFVIEQIGGGRTSKESNSPKKKRPAKKKNPTAHIQERKGSILDKSKAKKQNNVKNQPSPKMRQQADRPKASNEKARGKRQFTIRQKEE